MLFLLFSFPLFSFLLLNFKLLVYPVSILVPFFSNLIGGIVDVSNCFILHLKIWFVLGLLFLLLLSPFSPMSGSADHNPKSRLL
jgi:hypothetical protein